MLFSSKKINSSYITLFLIIVWDPLRTYLLSFSGSGFILMFFVSFVLFDQVFKKYFWKNLSIRPFSIWLLWILYALINTFFFNTYLGETSSFTFIFMIVLSLLVMVIINNPKNKFKDLIELFSWAFFTRILLSLLFDSIGILGKDTVTRLGENYNANFIAFGALFLIVILLFKKNLKLKIYYFDYIKFFMAILTIGLTASRKTTIVLVLILIGYTIINRSKSFSYNVIRYFITFSFLLILLNILIDHTTVGERILDSINSNSKANSKEEMFDDRAFQYMEGYRLFKEYPVNGIGLANFGHVSDFPDSAHSEYIVQFTECGLIGVLLWFLFHRYIILRLLGLRKHYPYKKIIIETFLTFILATFFLMAGTWFYNNPIYWVMIGLIIKYIKNPFCVLKEQQGIFVHLELD